MSRTVAARAVLDNNDLNLRPGMYASAEIMTQPIADAIQVPREAVIDTGERQIVFVVQSNGHFEPRNVRMGITGSDGRVEILEGLSKGETVVTSGQFLLDVESRTTEAIDKLRGASNPSPTTTPTTGSMGGRP
jgi:Cu(I)/Ag(I) efflux system membrane fusion protein/cobalt-zinc-cadmium efflux system membrane fusion protein